MFVTLLECCKRERDQALQRGDTEQVKRCDELLEEMGGREEYQRASQLSTSFHSTSKWVIGNLARRGWLYGITDDAGRGENDDNGQRHLPTDQQGDNINQQTINSPNHLKKDKRRKRPRRRATRLLEVGAINTELLDAASSPSLMTSGDQEYKDSTNDSQDDMQEERRPATHFESERQYHVSNKNYNLHVRAIDIHSTDERIEEADFLTLPYVSPIVSERYDVIVCSMVLNCVTTPIQRGKMLARLYHHLRPGGLCYLTLPKYCLTKSAFLTPTLFRQLLSDENGGVGFQIEETKESPKVAFFVCKRPEEPESSHQHLEHRLNPVFLKQVIRNKGKRFPNQFSVILEVDEVFGRVDPTLK